MGRHCPYCLNTLGHRGDQTFLHGSLEGPQVSKLYRGMAQIFGFHETLPPNPKDIFIWKIFFKGVNQKNRNYGREAFFKIINMSTAPHINNQIKLGSYATITITANYIQNQCKNILTNYPKSRFAHILSKQEILDGLKNRVLALRCGVEFCSTTLLIYLRFMYKKILRSYKKKNVLKKFLKKL